MLTQGQGGLLSLGLATLAHSLKVGLVQQARRDLSALTLAQLSASCPSCMPNNTACL